METVGAGRSGAYFFDQDVLDRPDATLGVKNTAQFFMPLKNKGRTKENKGDGIKGDGGN